MESQNWINLEKEVKLGELKYKKRVCSKCSDEQKKQRDCYILKGGKTFWCGHMRDAVNNQKRVKETHKKCISEMFGQITNTIEDKNKNRFGV